MGVKGDNNLTEVEVLHVCKARKEGKNTEVLPKIRMIVDL